MVCGREEVPHRALFCRQMGHPRRSLCRCCTFVFWTGYLCSMYNVIRSVRGLWSVQLCGVLMPTLSRPYNLSLTMSSGSVMTRSQSAEGCHGLENIYPRISESVITCSCFSTLVSSRGRGPTLSGVFMLHCTKRSKALSYSSPDEPPSCV
jgi:hypothetical protein